MASKSHADVRGTGPVIAHALVHLGLARHYRLTARQAGLIWSPSSAGDAGPAAYPQLAYARVTQTGLSPGGPFGKAGGYEA